VSNLKNTVAGLGLSEDQFRITNCRREWLLTKDMFTCFGCGDRKWNVFGVRRCDVNRITRLDDFLCGSGNGGPERPRNSFRTTGNNIVN
jgi:hypothetical protein